MKTVLEEALKATVAKSTNEYDALRVMQLSQAALNLAHALSVVSNVKSS